MKSLARTFSQPRLRLPLFVAASLALHVALVPLLNWSQQAAVSEDIPMESLSVSIQLSERSSGTGAFGIPEPDAVVPEPAEPVESVVTAAPATPDQPVQQDISRTPVVPPPEQTHVAAENASREPSPVAEVARQPEQAASQTVVQSETVRKEPDVPAQSAEIAKRQPVPVVKPQQISSEAVVRHTETAPADLSSPPEKSAELPDLQTAERQISPVPRTYAGMQLLDDAALAQVHSPDDSNHPDAARWRSIRFYLERLEKDIYHTWNGAGKWPQDLGGVIRFELDEQGGLHKVYVHLGSGRQDFDQSVLDAVEKAIHPFTADTRQLAVLNYRYFRFFYNSRGRVSRPKELLPWEREDLAAGNLERNPGS